MPTASECTRVVISLKSASEFAESDVYDSAVSDSSDGKRAPVTAGESANADPSVPAPKTAPFESSLTGIEGAGGVFKFLFRDTSKARIGVVLLLSGLGGMFEAALLILIVQVTGKATNSALANKGSVVSLHSLVDRLTVFESVLVGCLVALLSISLQLAATRLMVGIAADKMDLERDRIVNGFFDSSISDQSALPIGTIPDLAANTTAKLGDAVFQNGQSASSWVNLVVLILAAFAANPVTALAMVGVAGIVGLGFVPLSRKITQQARSWILKTRGYNQFLSIYTRMFLELRAFGVSDPVRELALERSRAVTYWWRKGRTLQAATPIAFRNLVLLLGFLCIGFFAVVFPSSVGSVAITALLLVRGLAYLQSILMNRQAVKASATNGELIDAMMLQLPADVAVWGDRPLTTIQSLSLEGVAHTYPGKREPTFTGVDLVARQGDFVAILGPSGGGKTTLLKVVMRTIEPTHGELLVNGTRLSEFTADSWYGSVAYLSQEVRLVPGTVADNIRFFREADDSTVEHAAAGAALDLSSHVFPLGLESHVEQDGSNLSGGQRQRIGLARCLLKNPQILVLDEPTSALDSGTEAEIMRTIGDLAPSMITVMVTHRVSTLAYTSHQYRMIAGELTELVPDAVVTEAALADPAYH